MEIDFNRLKFLTNQTRPLSTNGDRYGFSACAHAPLIRGIFDTHGLTRPSVRRCPFRARGIDDRLQHVCVD